MPCFVDEDDIRGEGDLEGESDGEPDAIFLFGDLFIINR